MCERITTGFGRRGDLMISALTRYGASDPGSSPGRRHYVVFSDMVPFPTHVYKWVAVAPGTGKLNAAG